MTRTFLFRFSGLMGLLAVIVMTPPGSAEPIRIGVSLPLTGPASTYGMDSKNVFEYALKRFGEGRFELLFEDDKCNPKEAVNVAHKFIEVERVRYVLGFPCSGTLLAAAPLYEKSKVLVVASLASSPKISQAGDYIFRLRPAEPPFMQALAEVTQTRHRRIGVLAEETDYAQDTKRTYLDALSIPRGQVFEENFVSDTADFRPYLLRMKQRRVEALVILAQSEAVAAQIVKQRMEVGLSTVRPYGSNAFLSGVFRNLAGAAAEGATIVSLPQATAGLTPEGTALFSEFVARYGELASVEYTFYISLESFRALKLAVLSGADPKEFLYRENFHGVFGSYSFDEHGDIVSALKPAIMEVQNSALVPRR